jgi:hypothetical protein
MLSFPTWGVQLGPLPGWGRVAERDLTIMGQWIPRDGSRGAITVVVTPLLQRTPRGAAQQIADMIGGTVDDSKLDGRSAKRVTGGSGGEAAMFAERAGYLYEIRYQHTPPDPAEFEAFRTGWRWSDIEEPIKHPEMRPDLVPVLDQFVVQLPTHMRPWSAAQAGTANFAAVDITGQRIKQQFRVDLSMPAGMQGKPLNELATALSDPIQAQLHLRNPIAWRLLEGKNDRIISQVLLEPPPQNSPPTFRPRFGTCMAIVALDGQRRVFINFLAGTEDPDQRSTFMSMGEKILASILPIEAVLPPKPAK